MSGELWLTVVGNLTADPELRFTAGGDAVCNFTVASTPRNYDKTAADWKDGETLFTRCTVWKNVAENVVESLGKGARVIVYGRYGARSYDKDGETRTINELHVEEIGPALRYASAALTRNPSSGGGGGRRPAVAAPAGAPNYPAGPAAEDPWAGGGDRPAF